MKRGAAPRKSSSNIPKLIVTHLTFSISAAPFRYITIGDNCPDEVCVYPDSNKIMVRSLDRAILRDGERLDYWDGEEGA